MKFKLIMAAILLGLLFSVFHLTPKPDAKCTPYLKLDREYLELRAKVITQIKANTLGKAFKINPPVEAMTGEGYNRISEDGSFGYSDNGTELYLFQEHLSIETLLEILLRTESNIK